MIACNGSASRDDDHPLQYDVTELGVVERPSSDELAVGATASPDWWELAVGDQHLYLPRGSRAIDSSSYHFGRGDLQYPTARTPIGVEIAGLAPWQDGDSLQLVSPNVGLAISGLEAHFTPPAAGSTTISGQSLDWKNAFSPLVERDRGDTTWLAQMSAVATDSGSHYNVLTRSGVARDFSVRDGRASTLTTTLAPVARDRTLALQWRGREFAALAAQAGPGARPAPAPALAIRALPDTLARHNSFFNSLYLYLPSLVELGPIRGAEDFAQTIAYGDPFSSNGVRWTELVTMIYAVPVAIPGVGVVHAMMVSATPVDALVDGVIAPTISPVRDVTIDGREVTWKPPAIGKSTGYRVAIQSIRGTELGTVAAFHTTATSIAIPAFALPAGSYVLTITAVSAPGTDLASRPFVGSLPYASADYVTARITP